MKKNKPSKIKSKPKRSSNLQKKDHLKDKGETSTISSARANDPFKFIYDLPNPFSDPFRSLVFRTSLRKLLEFAFLCKDLRLELGNNKELKELYKALKSDIEKISKLLEWLIPSEAKKKVKKNQFLRYLRARPENPVYLVYMVDEYYRPKLRKYYNPPYPRDEKGSKSKLGDIKKFWENEFGSPFPKKFRIDDRSETTIAVSILAYLYICDPKELLEIYRQGK